MTARYEPIIKSEKGEFDSLSMYHHATSFDHKLKALLSILAISKECELAERFKKIESLLDNTFRLELIHYLDLKNDTPQNLQTEPELPHPHPRILLHLWCLLECTDSLGFIAHYLELEVEEVQELIRELHNTFGIDSLISRLRQYYEQNKYLKEGYELHKRNELLGTEPNIEPKDTAEDRKQRLRRRYGHLGQVFDLMCCTPHIP